MLKTIVEPPPSPQTNSQPDSQKLPYTMVNTPPNVVNPQPTSSPSTISPAVKSSLIHNKSFVFGTVGILILAAGIGAAVFLSSQSQDSRKQASVPGGPVQISITPTEKTINVGETSTFTTFINTQGRMIAGISVRLSYTFSGSAPLLTASNPTPLIQQTNTSWNCMIAKTTVAEGKVNIDLGCTTSDTSGYSNSTNTPLFSVSLTAGQTSTSSPVVLAFEPNLTMVVDKQSGEDIAATPSSSASVTIVSNTATATPTPSPTAPAAATATPTPTGQTAATATPTPTRSTTAATATPTPTRSSITGTPTPTGQTTATATPTRTPTPTNTSSTTTYSCNHTCSANRDCQSSLACLNGYCRDPRCPSDTTCGCQNKNVASESGTSTLPESGGAPYSIWLSILGGLLIFSSINFAILLKKQV